MDVSLHQEHPGSHIHIDLILKCVYSYIAQLRLLLIAEIKMIYTILKLLKKVKKKKIIIVISDAWLQFSLF